MIVSPTGILEGVFSMDRILFGLLSLVLFSQPSFARDPLSDEEVAAIVEQFQYQGNYTETKSSKKGGGFSRCWVYTKSFETVHPESKDPLTVNMKLYIPNRDRLGKEEVPGVILIPPIGGENLLDRKTAETICDNKMAAFILTNDFANIQAQAEGQLLPPEDHQKTFYRIGAAVKGVMAMINDDANIDYGRMGIFGVSLGGILGSFIMATQPDISSGYFVVAGGDVPEILANSDQEEVSKIRRKRMKAEGFADKEEYEAFLREHIIFDPIDIAQTMIPETLNMVVAERDSNVPTSNQHMLHEAFGKPEATFYQDGHVGTVISFLFPASGRRKIARFFKARFEEDNPRPEVFDFLDNLVPIPAS